MTTKNRPQHAYDHRLRELVRRTGDTMLATNLGVLRSTARGRLRDPQRPVVSVDVLDLHQAQLQAEVSRLRRRVKRLIALLRLLVVVLRISGFRLTGQRLPDGHAKTSLLRAVDRSREFVPLRVSLRLLRLCWTRYHARRRMREDYTLDDRASCPRTSPHQLTQGEIQTIKEMVTSPEYRHAPTGTLAVLARRLGKVFASASTWHNLVRRFGWRRPRLRVHPAKPKVGLRTSRPDEAWHVDTTIIRLLDGTRAYLHAAIDDFSRRILSRRVADTFAPAHTVAILLEAARGTSKAEESPVVVTDGGVENVNGGVDEFIRSGLLHRVLAFTELTFSNSMIEAFWRSLKRQWLSLNTLDSVAAVRRLVEFYVREHNSVLPHSALRGRTPDEMYHGTGEHIDDEPAKAKETARRRRLEANRSVSCNDCAA